MANVKRTSRTVNHIHAVGSVSGVYFSHPQSQYFVVGRLARRHDVDVTLSDTPGGGLTAWLDLSLEHLVGRTDPLMAAGIGPIHATVGSTTDSLVVTDYCRFAELSVPRLESQGTLQVGSLGANALLVNVGDATASANGWTYLGAGSVIENRGYSVVIAGV